MTFLMSPWPVKIKVTVFFWRRRRSIRGGSWWRSSSLQEQATAQQKKEEEEERRRRGNWRIRWGGKTLSLRGSWSITRDWKRSCYSGILPRREKRGVLAAEAPRNLLSFPQGESRVFLVVATRAAEAPKKLLSFPLGESRVFLVVATRVPRVRLSPRVAVLIMLEGRRWGSKMDLTKNG